MGHLEYHLGVVSFIIPYWWLCYLICQDVKGALSICVKLLKTPWDTA